MASVSFFIRSKSKKGKIFLRFRATNIDVRVSTLKSIEPKDWNYKKNKAKPYLQDINTYLNDLENKILSHFEKSLNVNDWKKWLIDIIEDTSNNQEKNPYPDNLYDFIPVFIELKKNTIKKATIAKCKVIQGLIKQYTEYQNIKLLLFKDLDNNFLINFEKFSTKNKDYSISYTYKNLKFIKTMVKTAQRLGIEVNQSVASWYFPSPKDELSNLKPITLSFDELDIIENFKQPTESLENVKDWLLISCYTAQRVSDFSKFNIEVIITDEQIEYIEFKQTKTGTLMRVPLGKKVKSILEKRNGEFPRKISDQKFNRYVKIVVKNAGINQIIKGGKMINKRKKIGYYPKYELVSSHIGRRSFATNFYNLIPTSVLITATGHSTEKQLLTYIGKSEREKSKILARELEKLGF